MQFFWREMILLRALKISVYAKKQLYELEGNGVELEPCSAAAICSASKLLQHWTDSSPQKRSWFGFFLLLLEIQSDSIPTESLLLSPCKRADLGAACTAAANQEQHCC